MMGTGFWKGIRYLTLVLVLVWFLIGTVACLYGSYTETSLALAAWFMFVLLPCAVGTYLSKVFKKKYSAPYWGDTTQPGRDLKRERAFQALREAPDSTKRNVVVEREIVKEVVMVPCSYCGGLLNSTENKCPYCGAPRRIR